MYHFANDDEIRGALTPASIQRRQNRAKKVFNRYLRGPVPLLWLQRAAALPGKALAVAIVLRYLSAVKKREINIQVSPKLLREFSINRQAHYRALTKLEAGGLISVFRKRGAAPLVSILELTDDFKES